MDNFQDIKDDGATLPCEKPKINEWIKVFEIEDQQVAVMRLFEDDKELVVFKTPTELGMLEQKLEFDTEEKADKFFNRSDILGEATKFYYGSQKFVKNILNESVEDDED